MEAIDSFGSILKSNPRDFEVVRLCTLGNFGLKYPSDDSPSEQPSFFEFRSSRLFSYLAVGARELLLLPAGVGGGHQGPVLHLGVRTRACEGTAHEVRTVQCMDVLLDSDFL